MGDCLEITKYAKRTTLLVSTPAAITCKHYILICRFASQALRANTRSLLPYTCRPYIAETLHGSGCKPQ